MTERMGTVRHAVCGLVRAALIGCAGLAPLLGGGDAGGQGEQVVEVTIKEYTFVTRQVPLQLNVPTVIEIRNEDAVRHDFGSRMFDGALTRVESGGVVSYGRGIGGVFLDPARSASIRFTIERPGRYEFRCSLHTNMKGEILLMSVGAV